MWLFPSLAHSNPSRFVVPSELEADTESKDCALNPSQELADVCGLEDFGCLIDGCAGGVEEARDFLAVEAEMTDKECGHEVTKIDFSETDASTWGDIEYVNQTNPYLRLSKNSNTVKHTFTVPAGADMIEIGKFMLIFVADRLVCGIRKLNVSVLPS